ncbi:MAG: bifunctional diguanylate cyclase/phosphodiesterase [Clostridium sp.]
MRYRSNLFTKQFQNSIENIVSPSTSTILFASLLSLLGVTFITFIITSSSFLSNIILLICIFIFIIYIGSLIYLFKIEKRTRYTLYYLAFKDSLTNSPNWNMFCLTFPKLLSESNTPYTFVVLDIDNFKYINHTFGFKEGDSVIRHMASCIEGSILENELFCRLSNDYFALLLKYEDNDTTLKRLKHISSCISYPSMDFVCNHKLIVNCGIYLISNYEENIMSVRDNAILAQQSIKGGDSGSFVFYSDISKHINMEKQIEGIMLSALENKEFTFYLQPKFNLKLNKVTGAEALVRWFPLNHPEISPGKFIPIFEKNGFIEALDKYVFEEVCKTLWQWRLLGLHTLPISVNISRIHLNNPHFVSEYKAIIKKYNIDPSLIEIEITESAVFDHMDILIDILKKLKDIGFLVSMDDFGTGYSSLNMLREIPVDVLKLDKAFFFDGNVGDRTKIIVEGVVSIAKQLNVKVVSEGVESEEHVNFLRSIDCDMAQGYYFYKPMPVKSFEDIILDKL